MSFGFSMGWPRFGRIVAVRRKESQYLIKPTTLYLYLDTQLGLGVTRRFDQQTRGESHAEGFT